MSEYLEQTIRNLNTLVADGRYKEAYAICNKNLEKFPNERSLKVVKEKIEEEVLIENNKVIDRELKRLENVESEGDFGVILRQLKDLLKLNPGHRKLRKMYHRVQALYLKKSKVMSKRFREMQIQRLSLFVEKGEVQHVLDEVFKLQKNNPGNLEVNAVVKSVKDKLIEKMIKEKSELLYSEKFEEIGNFLERLKRIDPKNKRVLDLEPLVKGWKFSHQSNRKMEFVYKGMKHLDTLIKLGKIDKAYKVAGEILSLEPESKRLKKVYSKVKRMFYEFCRSKTVDIMESESKVMKEAVQRDRDSLIVI